MVDNTVGELTWKFPTPNTLEMLDIIWQTFIDLTLQGSKQTHVLGKKTYLLSTWGNPFGGDLRVNLTTKSLDERKVPSTWCVKLEESPFPARSWEPWSLNYGGQETKID